MTIATASRKYGLPVLSGHSDPVKSVMGLE
jgi:hypothetical protein